MSSSPSTPQKSVLGAATPSIVVAVPSLDKLTFHATKVKQESLNEPSPASTWGDTAAGDSVPATPQEIDDNGKRFSPRLVSRTISRGYRGLSSSC